MGSGAGAAGLGALGFLGQQDANAANKTIAADTRTWQTQMSNTAHQREVADLRAAGLNPILSANQGASTPNAPTATMQSSLGAGISAAADIWKLSNELKQTNSNIELQKAQALASAASAKRDAATAKQVDINSAIAEATMDTVFEKAKVEKAQYQYDKKYMEFDNISNRVLRGLQVGNSAKDMLNPLKGLFGNKKLKPWEGIFNGTKYNKGTGEIIP